MKKHNYTRRQFIQGLAKVGGLGAAVHTLGVLGLLSHPAAARQSQIPELTHGLGRGKKVVVIGAGCAGLCAGYLFAKSGFEVTILEAGDRLGGRSFTGRKGDRFREEGGPEQVCRFTDDDLYINLGPGRIPQHHEIVLDYCRRLGVQLEPYIYLCDANLFQSDKAFDGKPMPWRRLMYSLQGELSELLARSAKQGDLDLNLSAEDQEKFLLMLQKYGALNKDFKYRIPSDVSKGYARSGYLVEPEAGLEHGTAYPGLALEDILASGIWNEELFNSMEYYWQSSLMQPVGGMDMVWRAFADHKVPTKGGEVPLSELVQLNSPVTVVRNTSDGVEVGHSGQMVKADFCVSTVAPPQLQKMGEGFSTNFSQALKDIVYDPAAKIGWQTRERFWEIHDGIYGGISWTKQMTTQIWYPSSGFHSQYGVLTGSYTSTENAIEFGNMPIEERFEIALKGGELLHPGHYRKNVMMDTALAVAWHKMPYFMGGWPFDTFENRPKAYVRLAKAIPEGQVYLAGDYLSYWPGWQEGALGSANLAYNEIRDRITAG
jgi:monoamine oxidase